MPNVIDGGADGFFKPLGRNRQDLGSPFED